LASSPQAAGGQNFRKSSQIERRRKNVTATDVTARGGCPQHQIATSLSRELRELAQRILATRRIFNDGNELRQEEQKRLRE